MSTIKEIMESLFIHWHGVKNPRNPWFDGPEFITQCGIKPGTNFTYEIILSDEDGTLWWHAHSNWTRNTVHGAIVIYPEDGNSYPYPKPDGEDILILGSWYKVDVNSAVNEDLQTGTPLPTSSSYTINSQPGDFCPCSKESTYRLRVDYNKTYLLRVINAIMSAEVTLAIAEHDLTIVGMDGSYLKPFVTNHIVIGPGQTMDILITTNNSLGQYYIAIRQHYLTSLRFTSFDKTNVTAILEYKGNYDFSIPPSFPTDTLPSYYDIDDGMRFESYLKSLHKQDVPTNITTRMYITAALQLLFMNFDTSYVTASLNNISFVNPKMDVLQAYYRCMAMALSFGSSFNLRNGL